MSVTSQLSFFSSLKLRVALKFQLSTVLEQFSTIFAIFMLLEQLDAKKWKCIKNAQYVQQSHPCKLLQSFGWRVQDRGKKWLRGSFGLVFEVSLGWHNCHCAALAPACSIAFTAPSLSKSKRMSTDPTDMAVYCKAPYEGLRRLRLPSFSSSC